MKCWFDKLSSKVAQGCIRGSKLRSDRLVQRFRLVNSVLLWNALFFAAAFSSLSQAANIQDLQFSSLRVCRSSPMISGLISCSTD